MARMTCIAALAHDGECWIGGDAAGGSGWDLTRHPPKVFRLGPMVLGYAGSFRQGQLLQRRLEIPAHPPGMSADEYMPTLFMDAVRDVFRAGGWLATDKGREETGDTLIGYRGDLFRLASDGQAGRLLDPIATIGCGGPVALGALWACPRDTDPRRRVMVALEAAEKFNMGVRRPFTVVRGGAAVG